jgi:hypothetical protein
MLISELMESLAQSLRDIGMTQANPKQLLIFINQAVEDAKRRGVYRPINDDESVSLATDVYEYEVPEDFVFIDELWVADGSGLFPARTHDHKWRLVTVGDVPVIRFDYRVFTDLPDADGRALRIRGQGNLQKYTVTTETIEPGIESLLHERATMYGARNLGRLTGEENVYAATETQAFQTSELMIQEAIRYMGQRLYSRRVPGR